MTDSTPNPPPQQPPKTVLGYETPRDGKNYGGLALAGFVVSLCSLPLSCVCMGIVGIPASITGLVLSIVALRGMKRTGIPENRGFAIAGAVIGSVVPVLIVLSMVFYMAVSVRPAPVRPVRTSRPTTLPVQRP